MRKYTPDNFIFTLLVQDDSFSKKDLNTLEKYFISINNSFHNGYNSTEGGDSYGYGVSRILSFQDVLDIKNRIINSTDSFIQIAKDYNVSDSLIAMINNGRIWNNSSEYTYPLRINAHFRNIGGTNPNSKLSDEQVMDIRKQFVDNTLPELYKKLEGIISFSELKKILYGSQFKHLPIYRKYKKQWELNGTCIDYPSL